MTLRHEPAHPVDLTNFTREQLQALADDLRGRLLGTIIPGIEVAPQHGLTREEAEQLIQSYKEFQDLAKKIDFDSKHFVSFQSPLPVFSIVKIQDLYGIIDINTAVFEGDAEIVEPLTQLAPTNPTWPPKVFVPVGISPGKGTILPFTETMIFDRVTNKLVVLGKKL
jgi:hypothetical protein